MDTVTQQAHTPISQILNELQTTESGLSEKQAHDKYVTYGPNKFFTKERFRIFKLLWQSFFSPLILLLLVAGGISAFLGDIKDFLIIFIIVLISGGITFYQHFKADNAAEKLKKRVQLHATVIRDSIQKEVPFSALVPGDIIILTAGDMVPADGRILSCKDFAVDEATLTGESFPAQKSTTIPTHDTILSQINNMVFGGTHVVSGEATVCIVATGKKTQLGKLAKEILKPKPLTDFDKGIENLSILLIKVIISLCLFVFLINALFHHELLSSFTFAVALAVGLTPELMPVILTINLSRGALRMEKKDVIVKYLPAIQNFGSMDILCTDKTGTLTESNISLVDYLSVTEKRSDNVLLYGVLASLHASGVKDPLDKALLQHEHTLPINEYKKLDELPFDFSRKRSSVVVSNTSNKVLLITKGAPQKIIEICTTYNDGRIHELNHDKKEKINKYINSLNQQGLRVLLVAQKEITRREDYNTADEKNMCLEGYLIFHDPVKATVYKTLNELKQLGISVKILTGDSEITTAKVCKDVNIAISGILTGEELDKMTDKELEKAVEENTIFARLTPQHKSRVIDALRKNNHVVGYLGDGVNDAPPLKAADVGISVNNGSDIARDVADIVLLKKSLATLQEGVLEGRKTHANIFKYILMSLSSNFGNMISVAIASLFLPFLPLLAIQILLIDFLYDLSQITIPSDTVDYESIEKPQKWSMPFLKKFMLTFGPISSLFDIATFIGLFFIFHASIPLFRTGWFVESVVTQTLIIFAIRTRRIPFIKSLPSIPVMISALLTLSVCLFLISSPISPIFSFVKLPIFFYVFLGIVILAYYTFVEFGKLWFYNHVQTQ